MKLKTTTYETVTLSLDEVHKLLIKGLELDKSYKLNVTHSGDVIWDYKLEFTLTKTTEKK